jgi:hypothetical protein
MWALSEIAASCLSRRARSRRVGRQSARITAAGGSHSMRRPRHPIGSASRRAPGLRHAMSAAGGSRHVARQLVGRF